jgi:hypothetical protein
MKEALSIIVEIVPILVVTWWIGRRDGHQRKMLLKAIGSAFAASGVCTFFGSKYFGLAVFGRRSIMVGERAIGASLFMIALGVGIFLLHYLLAALFPGMRSNSKRMKKEANQSLQRTRSARR